MIIAKNGKCIQKRSDIIKIKVKTPKNSDDKKDPGKCKKKIGHRYNRLPWKNARLGYHKHDSNKYERNYWYHNGPKNTSRSYDGNKISALFEEIKENIKSLENLDKILNKKHDGSIKKVTPSKKFDFDEYSKSYLKVANMEEVYNAIYLCQSTDF